MLSMLIFAAALGCFLLAGKRILTRSLPLTKKRQLRGTICIVLGLFLLGAGIGFSGLLLFVLPFEI